MSKAKLTPEDVAEIRRQYEYGRKRKLILAEFHITYHALWQIVNGRVHKTQSLGEGSALIQPDGRSWRKRTSGPPSKHPKMTAPQREAYLLAQFLARCAVSEAIRKGQLQNLRGASILCVDCKKNKATHYEHRDYSKPLDVEPVCPACNSHRGQAKY